MTEECKDCRFYQAGYQRQGHCRNIDNAKLEWVGGGNEYSSSRQCLVPQDVYETQGCERFSAGPKWRPIPIRPMSEQQRYDEEMRMRQAYADSAARQASWGGALNTAQSYLGNPYSSLLSQPEPKK